MGLTCQEKKMQLLVNYGKIRHHNTLLLKQKLYRRKLSITPTDYNLHESHLYSNLVLKAKNDVENSKITHMFSDSLRE